MPSSRFAPTRPNRRDDDHLICFHPVCSSSAAEHLPDRRLTDVRAETQRQLGQSGFAARLQPGARWRLASAAAASRNIAAIVQSVVGYWRDHGMEPFIFPVDGQSWRRDRRRPGRRARAFRHHRSVHGLPDCQPRSTWFRSARTDDGIEVVHGCRGARRRRRDDHRPRQVAHRPSTAGIESGLMKMMAIGLGKFAGAQNITRTRSGSASSTSSARPGRRVLQSGKMIGGLAIIEDAHHNTAKLDAVPAGCLEQRDEENLALANRGCRGCRAISTSSSSTRWARTSAAPAWTRRSSTAGPTCEYNPWPGLPSVRRIFVRDLDPAPMATRSGSAWRT